MVKQPIVTMTSPMTEEELSDPQIQPQIIPQIQRTLAPLKASIPTAIPTAIASQSPSKDSLSKDSLSKEERKELAMGKAGITDDVVMKVAYEGMTATKKTEEYDAQGNVVVVEVPDHHVRIKYLEPVLRMKGYIRADASVDATVNFNLTVNERDAIRGRLRKVVDI